MQDKGNALGVRIDELIAADEADELTIEELDTVAAGISISSLGCVGCPVSSVSSVAPPQC